MKTFINFFFLMIVTTLIWAQTPEGFKYQAVARNSSGDALDGQMVGLRFSVLKGSITGVSVYSETHTATTNEYGLFALVIGDGDTNDTFGTIDWSQGTFFLKIEMDASGGTSYTEYGTSQLMSVPYALHSKTAENISGPITETDPVFEDHAVSEITPTDIDDWSAAYDWGDHSKAGYLSSIAVETDPVFVAHAASGISSTRLSNWDTAYDWGDHAAAGYLSSFSESDPEVGGNTTDYLSKWDGSALVSSSIFDDGTDVGIGISDPEYNLDIGGPTYVEQILYLGYDDIPTYSFPISTGIGSIWFTGKIGGVDMPGAMIMATAAETWELGKNGTDLSFSTTPTGSTLHWRMTLKGNGNLGIGTIFPVSKLQINDGDVYLDTVGTGVIMKSPDGNCWRLTIDNAGAIQTTGITCPTI